MNLPDLDPARSPEVLFSDLREYISKAHALLDARDTVNLAGLDSAIEALCKRIVALDAEESKRYAGQLTEMLQSIETLQNKMTSLQGEIATTIKSLTNQKKAARAYINAPPLQPKVED